MDVTTKDNRRPQPTTKRRLDREGDGFYPSPAWATHALLQHESFEGIVEDPACGNGAMLEVLRETGQEVRGFDLYDRGYGETGHDFLASKCRVANIVTNPPYDFAEGFVRKGLELAERKLALLLRLAFLESAKRARAIYAVNPPTRVWVFSERITFYPNGEQTAGNGTTAYAWFVWDRLAPSRPTELHWCPPGYRARFSPESARGNPNPKPTLTSP